MTRCLTPWPSFTRVKSELNYLIVLLNQKRIAQVRPADSVEKLLSDWDYEDGVTVRTSGAKKGSFWKNELKTQALNQRDTSGLKALSKRRREMGGSEPKGIYHPSRRNHENAEYEAFLDECDERPHQFLTRMRREVEMKERITKILCKNICKTIYKTAK